MKRFLESQSRAENSPEPPRMEDPELEEAPF
jgi:hypothetical protein